MTLRSVWAHLRVPFSFFLLPVFLFALSQSPHPDWGRTVVVFLTIHFLLYPASNAYNSYFDKDEGSIGLLEAPPAVDKTLFYVSWVLDMVALFIGFWVGVPFVLYLLVYGAISKAYSHPLIRLKKYPIASWLIVSAFQGGFTYLMTLQAINHLSVGAVLSFRPLLAAALCTLNLLATYPVTQIYQHEEDARRGDMTISRLLGIRGTFLNAVIVFLLIFLGFYRYFGGMPIFWVLPICLFPAIVFFLLWYRRVHYDVQRANFRSAMRVTWLAGSGLNIFFLCLIISTYS